MYILFRANAVQGVTDNDEWGNNTTDKIVNVGGVMGMSATTRQLVYMNTATSFQITADAYDELVSKLPQIARGDFVVIEG